MENTVSLFNDRQYFAVTCMQIESEILLLRLMLELHRAILLLFSDYSDPVFLPAMVSPALYT